MSFYVQIRSSWPKIDHPCKFQQFPRREKFFHFVNFRDVSMRKEQQQPPWLINFAKIWSEHVLKIKTKVTKFGHHRIRGFWLAAVSLIIRAFEPPPPPGLIGLRFEKTEIQDQFHCQCVIRKVLYSCQIGKLFNLLLNFNFICSKAEIAWSGTPLDKPLGQFILKI